MDRFKFTPGSPSERLSVLGGQNVCLPDNNRIECEPASRIGDTPLFKRGGGSAGPEARMRPPARLPF